VKLVAVAPRAPDERKVVDDRVSAMGAITCDRRVLRKEDRGIDLLARRRLDESQFGMRDVLARGHVRPFTDTHKPA
jgi:hypothetical protein